MRGERGRNSGKTLSAICRAADAAALCAATSARNNAAVTAPHPLIEPPCPLHSPLFSTSTVDPPVDMIEVVVPREMRQFYRKICTFEILVASMLAIKSRRLIGNLEVSCKKKFFFLKFFLYIYCTSASFSVYKENYNSIKNALYFTQQ